MSQCLNPDCLQLNLKTTIFCQKCGSKLLLRERYRALKILGQGGFGAVYRAWDTNLSRPCAVKENLETSPEAHRQFGREASVLANLSHPNLPRVTDHFSIEGQDEVRLW